MQLTVAGKDRSGDLAREIVAEAQRLAASVSVGTLSPGHSALRLKDAADPGAYLAKYLELLRIRHGVRTGDFPIARRAGGCGRAWAAVKQGLWKLLRYQHERIAHQQNLINELAIHLAEFQRDEYAREIADLRGRVERMERERQAGAAP